jgi:hypothetical protein
MMGFQKHALISKYNSELQSDVSLAFAGTLTPWPLPHILWFYLVPGFSADMNIGKHILSSLFYA